MGGTRYAPASPSSTGVCDLRRSVDITGIRRKSFGHRSNIGRSTVPAKPKTPKFIVDVDDVDFAVDRAMERILERDGRKTYEAASGELLTFFTNTIAHMDGGPKRLLGMLHRLEAMHAKPNRDGASNR
jgi:hypothetical protein